MEIHTHVDVDLDAIFSVLAAWEFVPGARNAPVAFVSARWDGAGMNDDDLALDLEAGGRGWKGAKDADGTVHSCFSLIVKRYASSEDQVALAPLVAFVDEVDARGFHPLAERLTAGMNESDRNLFFATNLISIVYSFKENAPGNDRALLWHMSVFFSGFLKRARMRQGAAREEALAEVARAELFGGGVVAILRDHRQSLAAPLLFARGVRVIVYVDGYNLGVVRANGVKERMDDPLIRAVVEAAGEDVYWFRHSNGFLYCWGSRKAPASEEDHSRVDPRALAEAAAQVLTNGKS